MPLTAGAASSAAISSARATAASPLAAMAGSSDEMSVSGPSAMPRRRPGQTLARRGKVQGPGIEHQHLDQIIADLGSGLTGRLGRRLGPGVPEDQRMYPKLSKHPHLPQPKIDRIVPPSARWQTPFIAVLVISWTTPRPCIAGSIRRWVRFEGWTVL